MTHGSQQYFAERARFEARLSALTVSVAAALLGLLVLVQHSPLRDAMNHPEHFGFEGPERYVERIELETYGQTSNSLDVPFGVNFQPRAERGGGTGHERQRIRERATRFAHGPLGPGNLPSDLMARALRRSSSVPLVQSDLLVFERLVRARYPEEAQRRGIEGRFAILALIDTSGHVVEVEVQRGDPNGILEREAASAVLRCVIRPYRVAGVPSEIVARFPFNFYLRE